MNLTIILTRWMIMLCPLEFKSITQAKTSRSSMRSSCTLAPPLVISCRQPPKRTQKLSLRYCLGILNQHIKGSQRVRVYFNATLYLDRRIWRKVWEVRWCSISSYFHLESISSLSIKQIVIHRSIQSFSPSTL